jgi:hypothetical protein
VAHHYHLLSDLPSKFCSFRDSLVLDLKHTGLPLRIRTYWALSLDNPRHQVASRYCPLSESPGIAFGTPWILDQVSTQESILLLKLGELKRLPSDKHGVALPDESSSQTRTTEYTKILRYIHWQSIEEANWSSGDNRQSIYADDRPLHYCLVDIRLLVICIWGTISTTQPQVSELQNCRTRQDPVLESSQPRESSFEGEVHRPDHAWGLFAIGYSLP